MAVGAWGEGAGSKGAGAEGVGREGTGFVGAGLEGAGSKGAGGGYYAKSQLRCIFFANFRNFLRILTKFKG